MCPMRTWGSMGRDMVGAVDTRAECSRVGARGLRPCPNVATARFIRARYFSRSFCIVGAITARQ